jgi:anti-sigma factor RsiW
VAHELTHADASELLGVFALDALDADEREAVERHLADCDFCRAEVQEHMEMAALLSTGVFRAPGAVWDRISSELEGTPPPLDLAPIHALRPVPPPPPEVASPPAAEPTDGRPDGVPDQLAERRAERRDGRRDGRGDGRRGAGIRIGALVAAASVAATVIGVLGIKVVEDGRRIDQITAGVHGEELQRTINAAMADPAVVKVSMRSIDGQLFAEAWVLPDGRAYLARNNLPTLGADRNYQLWAVVGDNRISVGLLGPKPEPAAFVASGPVAALAITDEAAGGVISSLQQPVVVGPVRQS